MYGAYRNAWRSFLNVNARGVEKVKRKVVLATKVMVIRYEKIFVNIINMKIDE